MRVKGISTVNRFRKVERVMMNLQLDDVGGVFGPLREAWDQFTSSSVSRSRERHLIFLIILL